MFSRPLIALSQRPASPANSVTFWAYSSVSLIKWVASFAMAKKRSFVKAVFGAVVFVAAFSAHPAIISRYISVFLSIFMPALTMGGAMVRSIRGLFSACCPSTIFGLIVSVIINSVNRRSLWTLSHILKKVSKTILPSIANFDASAAIVFIMRVFRVIAPAAHIEPNAINRVFGYFHGLYNRRIKNNSQTNKIGDCYAI